MRIKQLSLAVALAAAAMTAQASSVVKINPDGIPGGDPVINVLTLDWSPGNSLAVPTGSLARAADVQLGDVLQTYAHARLSSFKDASNVNIGVPGLGSTYEWTYVAAFQEQAALNSFGQPFFQVISGGINFFEIWVGSPDSSDLTGHGFSNGTRILWGTVLPYDSSTGVGSTSFTVTTPNAGALDQNGANNYPGINTIGGTGGGQFAVEVVGYDSNYFLTPPTIITANFDTQINLPYRQVDPSSCFWNGTAYISGAGPSNLGLSGECTTNTVGPVNGLPSGLGGSGPNNMLFQDASTSFKTSAIPEPTTLALLGLGLAGLGMSLRRRG